jgi:hypothetical protein
MKREYSSAYESDRNIENDSNGKTSEVAGGCDPGPVILTTSYCKY